MRSATPSCATALRTCETHIPISICSTTACGGGASEGCCESADTEISSLVWKSYAPDVLPDCLTQRLAQDPGKRFGRTITDAIVLARHHLLEDRAPILLDRGGFPTDLLAGPIRLDR